LDRFSFYDASEVKIQWLVPSLAYNNTALRLLIAQQRKIFEDNEEDVKKAVVTFFKVMSQHLSSRTEKNHKTSARTAELPSGQVIQNHQNTPRLLKLDAT
jgi:hypothetical protein